MFTVFFIHVWNVVAWFVLELSAKGDYQVACDWLSVKFCYSSALHECEDVLTVIIRWVLYWMYSHTIQMAEIGYLQSAITISCSEWLLHLCHVCLCWRVWFASCTCFQAGQMIYLYVPLHKYEGCSESNAPHFFFSETIYSECMKFTHSITGCFFYTCYFST